MSNRLRTMNLNGYTQHVARTQKALLPIDARIAEILAQGVEEAEITRRTLADMTGMSLNRLGIILRQEPPPATVGEVGAIARAIGTTASAVTAQAERDVAGLSDNRGTSNVTHASFGEHEALSPDNLALVANDSIDEHPDYDDAEYE